MTRAWPCAVPSSFYTSCDSGAPGTRRSRGADLEQQAQDGLLRGIQYLRFVAALMVVLAHAWQMVPIVGGG